MKLENGDGIQKIELAHSTEMQELKKKLANLDSKM